jgi:hypothetical protein
VKSLITPLPTGRQGLRNDYTDVKNGAWHLFSPKIDLSPVDGLRKKDEIFKDDSPHGGDHLFYLFF